MIELMRSAHKAHIRLTFLLSRIMDSNDAPTAKKTMMKFLFHSDCNFIPKAERQGGSTIYQQSGQSQPFSRFNTPQIPNYETQLLILDTQQTITASIHSDRHWKHAHKHVDLNTRMYTNQTVPGEQFDWHYPSAYSPLWRGFGLEVHQVCCFAKFARKFATSCVVRLCQVPSRDGLLSCRSVTACLIASLAFLLQKKVELRGAVEMTACMCFRSMLQNTEQSQKALPGSEAQSNYFSETAFLHERQAQMLHKALQYENRLCYELCP